MRLSDLPGRSYGINEGEAGQVAFERAFQECVSIQALCGAQYFTNQKIIEEAQKQLINHVSSFAINARRTLELYGIRDAVIENPRYKYAVEIEDHNEETNLRKALGRIIHARILQVLVMERDSTIYLNNRKEWVFTYLAVKSDEGDLIHVSPSGMAFSFFDRMSGVLHNAS